MYADVITIDTSWPVVADLITGLNIYLSKVLSYIKTTDSANGQICSNTFHARYSRAPLTSTCEAVRPSTTARKETVKTVLGVTLDTQLTITQHCNNIAVKVQQRNNVLKALVGSTWGYDKETLLTTYQVIGRSMRSTAAPSGRLHLWTLTGAGSNGHKIRRWELPLAVLKWLMSPNCIKRLGNYQFACITNWFSSSSP